MPSNTRYRLLAILTAALAVAGLLLAGLELMSLPEPQGDGLPTFFGAAFALLFGLGALAALAEAGLLAAAVIRSNPGPWSRGLLAVGATAGSLATLPRALGTAEFVDVLEVSVPWVRAWALLALIGVICTGVGVLAGAVEPIGAASGLALGGGVFMLIGLLVAEIAGEVVPGIIWLHLLAVAGFCVMLGGTLRAVGPLDRTPVRGGLAAVVLLGTTVAVWQLLAGKPADATLAALVSLATLWTLAATVESSRPPTHS